MRSYWVMNRNTNLPIGIAHELPESRGHGYIEVAVMPKLSCVLPIEPSARMDSVYYKLVFDVRGETLLIDPGGYSGKVWDIFVSSPERWTPIEDLNKIPKRRFWRFREMLRLLMDHQIGPATIENELRPFVQSSLTDEL